MADRDMTAGYDLVVAANWLPVHHDPLRWRDVAGSTARSLRTVVAPRGGAWIGCSWGTSVEASLLDDVWLHPVVLSQRESADYYHGHCLSTLRPLSVDCGPQPLFRPRWRKAYRQVNFRVAGAAARIAAPGATVWVHDYHLQLVPGYLRQTRPDLRIGFVLHAPFPPIERFAQQPMRDQILAGLLGADLVGFQQARSAINFLQAAAHIGGLRRDGRRLQVGDRQVTVGIFPASVDAAGISRMAASERVRQRARAIRATVGDPRLVLLSVGAPDQAEGVRRRLDGYAQLLAEGRLDALDTVLMHVALCGDEDLSTHDDEQDHIDRQVAQINGMYGRLGRPVIHYVRREIDPVDLIALYVAADVMLAIPLRQGMTLAAKEFVAARTADTGRLVLSEFSGAAADLPEAEIVNPHDIEAVKATILRAAQNCHAASEEMRTMRQRLHVEDAEAWARGFLAALAKSAPHGRPDVTAEARP